MLPIRFPTMLPTRSAVLAELQANEAAWRQRLTELDGLAEVVVRAQEAEVDHEPESASDGSGTTYLVNRAAAIHRREALVAEISELVRTWTREIKVLPPQQGVRLACLVADADVRAAERRGHHLAAGTQRQTGRGQRALAGLQLCRRSRDGEQMSASDDSTSPFDQDRREHSEFPNCQGECRS